MRYATLLSGGKDSVLAHHVAHQWGWEPAGVLVVRPTDAHSPLFHTPNLEMARLQAEAMGLPHHEAMAPPDEDGEQAALDAVVRHAGTEWGADTVVTGAVASEYQRVRVERAGHRAGAKTHHPLWHKPAAEILKTLTAGRYDVRFSAVAAEGLGPDWLGARLDEEAATRLLGKAQDGLHPAGEGGEYETVVLDAPLFARRIDVVRSSPEWRRDAGAWRILEARLAPRP